MDRSRRNFLKTLLFGAVAAPVLGVMKAPEVNVLKNQQKVNTLEIKPKPAPETYNDTWGASLTPLDVNASNFGMASLTTVFVPAPHLFKALPKAIKLPDA